MSLVWTDDGAVERNAGDASGSRQHTGQQNTPWLTQAHARVLRPWWRRSLQAGWTGRHLPVLETVSRPTVEV